MAMNSASSGIVSLALSLMVYAGMQFFKVQLGSSELFTIVGGFAGSLLFMLLLTGLNNLENAFLDDYFQAKIFPEVVLALGAAMFSCAMVHRVSVTTCLLFSLIHLFFINKISASMYQSPAEAAAALKQKVKKRKH